jgi:hypothetical protein
MRKYKNILFVIAIHMGANQIVASINYAPGLVYYKQPILAKALFIVALFRWLKPTAMNLASLPSHLWGG